MLIFIGAQAQGFKGAEYFFDSDPGVGNGIPLAVTGNDEDLIQHASISTTGLSMGFHIIGIRFLRKDGIWTQTESRGFFILSPSLAAKQITAAEYFFDADPGVGKGIVLPVGNTGENVSQAASVSTSSLSSGFHFIGTRFLRQDGVWAQTEARGFYILTPQPDESPIVAAEYFIDADPGVGKGISMPVDGLTMRNKDTVLLPMGALPKGNYLIGIRLKNSEGKWTLNEYRPFNICSVAGPLSVFKHQVEYNTVFYENHSTGADSIKWLFGDNTSDTVLNPVKVYNGAGNYPVKLITKNECGTDTATQSILVNGLQGIYATSGADSGIATITFNGIGFTEATTVQLLQGNLVLTPVSFKVLSSTRITALFYFNKVPLGNYHAIASITGSNFDTLKNAYTIVPYRQATVRISGANGPKFSRPGSQFREYYIANDGSEDAIMVPFITRMGYSTGLFSPQMYPQGAVSDLRQEGIFQQTYQYLEANHISKDVMSVFAIDTLNHRQLYAGYKVKIPARSTVTTTLNFYGNIGNIYYGIGAMLQKPMYYTGLSIADQQSPVRDCMNSFLRKAVRRNISANIDSAGWTKCFNTAFDTLTASIQGMVNDFNKSQLTVPMQAVFATLLSQVLQCGGSGLPATVQPAAFKKTITEVVYNWIFWENLDSMGRPCFDTTESFVFEPGPGTISADQGYAASTLETEEGPCPGLQGVPELLEQCLPFLKACGYVEDMETIDNVAVLTVGKKFLTGPSGLLDNVCKLNSGSVFCEKLCEGKSSDPNQKFGPGDNRNEKYINTTGRTGYTIYFENVATAAANAAFVEIADTIDLEKFDIQSFQLGNFGWADSTVRMDPGRTNFSAIKNLRPAMPNNLRIDFRLDTLKGIANWKFYTLDTLTNQLTINALEGFLPPNINGREGLGYVSFSIAPRHGVVTSGTVLQNKAGIVFDDNEAIITPVWEHIIDTTRPESRVLPLPPVSNTVDFVVNWSGADAHAGIASYCVYVSINDSMFIKWKDFTTAQSDTFHGKYLNTYKFYSRALDRANNFEKPLENPLANPDAVITLEAVLPVHFVNFSAVKSENPDRVKLTWKATNETNADSYIIERSNDGRKFLAIGSVAALRNAGNNSYEYIDSMPGAGKNYYRLRQVDTDGGYLHSHILVVNFAKGDAITIFPTITKGNFSVNGVRPGTKLRIIDMQGRVMQMRNVKSSAEVLDISAFSSGIYLVQIGESNNLQSFRIFKQ